MTKSNAERQAEFRSRMKARGFREKLIWIDQEGHQGTARTQEQEQKPALTINQLSGQLKKITSGMDANAAGRLFAELAAHARGLRGKWDLNEKALEKELAFHKKLKKVTK
jgi:hypothetical protein